MDRAIKVYVQVIVKFDENGTMLPRFIVWETGERFEVDRVLDIRQAASLRCGGQGDRYTVMICGKQRYLFFERNASITGCNIGRWFVEKKVA